MFLRLQIHLKDTFKIKKTDRLEKLRSNLKDKILKINIRVFFSCKTVYFID